jgi:hypothetical protein
MSICSDAPNPEIGFQHQGTKTQESEWERPNESHQTGENRFETSAFISVRLHEGSSSCSLCLCVSNPDSGDAVTRIESADYTDSRFGLIRRLRGLAQIRFRTFLLVSLCLGGRNLNRDSETLLA